EEPSEEAQSPEPGDAYAERGEAPAATPESGPYRGGEPAGEPAWQGPAIPEEPEVAVEASWDTPRHEEPAYQAEAPLAGPAPSFDAPSYDDGLSSAPDEPAPELEASAPPAPPPAAASEAAP